MADLKCYKIRVETPKIIMSYGYIAPMGLTKSTLTEREEDKWEEVGRRHNWDVKVKVTSIPCSRVNRVSHTYHKKGRK